MEKRRRIYFMAKKEVKLDSNGYRKFGMRDKIAYAAGDFGCNMSFALISSYMADFYTQYIGIPAAAHTGHWSTSQRASMAASTSSGRAEKKSRPVRSSTSSTLQAYEAMGLWPATLS